MDKDTREAAVVLQGRGLSAKEAHARLEATHRPCTLAEVEEAFGGKSVATKAKAAPKKK
jgi:hypothetical protein